MSVKVMYLPLNYGDVLQDGVYDAFRSAGCDLNVFDYMNKYVRSKNKKNIRTELVDSVKSFQPDILFLQIQHTTQIDAITIQKAQAVCPTMKIVNWTGDVRNGVPPTFKKIGKISNFNLISSTGQIPMFKKVLDNVDYLQIGYNPKLYHPALEPKSEYKFDISFIGHHNTKERYPGAPLRYQVTKDLRLKFGNKFGLFGSGWDKSAGSKGSLDQRKLLDVYHNSFCNLSISHFNDIDHYFSDRLLMCMAAGRPVIALRFPKWESYFTNNSDLIIVNSADEIPEKVKMLKLNPDLADFIGAQGAAKVKAEHTYTTMVRKLLDKVGL